MRVRVRVFASLRELAGRGEWELNLPEPASVDDAWRRLVAEHPALVDRRPSLLAAVNHRYGAFDTTLADGDEVAFIPPVSGG